MTLEELRRFLSWSVCHPPRRKRPGCSRGTWCGAGSERKQWAWGKSKQLRRVQQGRVQSVRPSREAKAERGVRMRNVRLTRGFWEAAWRSRELGVTTGTDPTLPGANSIWATGPKRLTSWCGTDFPQTASLSSVAQRAWCSGFFPNPPLTAIRLRSAFSSEKYTKMECGFINKSCYQFVINCRRWSAGLRGRGVGGQVICHWASSALDHGSWGVTNNF